MLVHAGAPSWLYLQASLTGDGRVGVHVTGRDGERLDIPGFTPSPEIEGALWFDCELDELPSMAVRVLHEHLVVGESEPLFIELGSDSLPDEP